MTQESFIQNGILLRNDTPIVPANYSRRDRILTTYSQWSAFRDCQQLMKWRYLHELVPVRTRKRLLFGKVAHEALELWYATGEAVAALKHVDASYMDRHNDSDQKADWHVLRAMMRAYTNHHAAEHFKVVGLEIPFETEIVNPLSGRISRSFVLGGKIDGLVLIELDGRYYLLEHKTVTRLTGSYIDKLWSDLQIILYSYALGKILGIQISGVIYNILICGIDIKQHKGESEEEFELRRAEAAKKTKTGTTSIKRKIPESDEEFAARLAEKYANPAMFIRQELFISPDDILRARIQLWNMTQAYLHALRTATWYQNTAHCHRYGSECAYFPLCQSNGDPYVIQEYYEHKPSHEELLPQTGDSAVTDDEPVF